MPWARRFLGRRSYPLKDRHSPLIRLWAKRIVWLSTNGSEIAEPMTPWSISIWQRAIRNTRRACHPPMTAAITCIPMTSAIRQWPRPSIFRFSMSSTTHTCDGAAMPISLYRTVEELDLVKDLVSTPAGVLLLQLQDQVLDLKR